MLQAVGDAPGVARDYLRRVNQDEADLEDLRAEKRSEEVAASAAAEDDTASTVATASEPVAPGRPRITPDGEHWGGGEISITSVDFLGVDGKAVSGIGERSPLRIRIGYEADGSYESPTFGIAIHNETGLHVTGTNTRLSRLSTGIITGSGFVEYTTDRLPLLAGVYDVSVAIEDQYSQHTFDRYDQGWVLRVRHDGDQAVHGMVDIGGDWRIDPSSAGR